MDKWRSQPFGVLGGQMWYQLKAQNVTGVCVQKLIFLKFKKFQTKAKNININRKN